MFQKFWKLAFLLSDVYNWSKIRDLKDHHRYVESAFP